jgi:tRNA(Ile)-lysidine synthase
MTKDLTTKPISDAEAAALFAPLTLDEVPVLVLAVSGGPDSTALMWLAARWRDSLKDPPRLVAVTVDHGLRPESAREALGVKRLAAELKVEHKTLPWTGRKPKTAIQEAARNARYRLLAQAAHRAGSRCVVTAHTLDDQAETVLFRMARGTGVSGLAGMILGPHRFPVPEGRDLQLFRPLLAIPKARLIATLKSAKLPYAVDPSNADPRFARPRLRKLMPRLATEGLTAQRLALLARRVSRVEVTLDDILNEALMRLAPGPWPEKGPISVEMRAFSDLPDEIALRFLDRLIEWTGDEGPVELGKLEALFEALREAMLDALTPSAKPAVFRRTLAGAMVTLTAAKLTVERAPPRRRLGKPRTAKTPFTKAR